MSGERVIQAEKPTNAKYLKQECAWNVPEKSGWPVYLQQNEREGNGFKDVTEERKANHIGQWFSTFLMP